MRRLLRILDAPPPDGHTLLYINSQSDGLYMSCKPKKGDPIYIKVTEEALMLAADSYYITDFGRNFTGRAAVTHALSLWRSAENE